MSNNNASFIQKIFNMHYNEALCLHIKIYKIQGTCNKAGRTKHAINK